MIFFITGGTGYLGSRLSAALKKQGHKLHFLVRGTSDVSKVIELSQGGGGIHYESSDRFDDLFEKYGIEVVLHCATHYGRKDTDPFNTIKSNLLLPVRLLDSAASVKLKAFISTGTMLDKRVNYYSLSKSQFDDWMYQYSDRINCINVLLEHFYGPNDDPTKFVTYIVNELLANVGGIDLTKGEQERDFVYIDDVVEAFLTVISHIDSFQGMTTLEVGSGESIKIRDFVMLAKSVAKNHITNLNFGAIPYRDKEIMHSKADISQLTKLGWVNKTTLKVGLEKTIWGGK